MHRRTPITLLAALMLALALCAPAFAFAQETEEPAAGDEPAVEAQGTSEDGPDGEPESGAEASGEDDGFENTNGRDDVNCEEDFDFQEDAQEFFDSQGGLDGEDEDRLDEDPGEDDGDACEDLPSRDDSDSGSTPSGGVDSGAGGMAAKPDGGSIAPLVLGGLAATAALLAVFGVAVRRRA